MPAAGTVWKEVVAKVRKGQEPRTSCLGQRARHLLITAFTLLFTEHLLLLWTYKAPSSECRSGTGLVREVSSRVEDSELIETRGEPGSSKCQFAFLALQSALSVKQMLSLFQGQAWAHLSMKNRQ